MNSQIPGWVWFLTGLVTGLFLAFLIYLGKFAPPAGEVLPGGQAGLGIETEDQSDVRFPLQFQEMLRNSEVPLVEERFLQQEGAEEGPTRYMLQTGSFSTAEDADRMRARLLLMGMEAFTRKVAVRGDLRHRVLIGPLDTRGELNLALDRLAEAEIESIALKIPAANP